MISIRIVDTALHQVLFIVIGDHNRNREQRGFWILQSMNLFAQLLKSKMQWYVGLRERPAEN